MCSYTRSLGQWRFPEVGKPGRRGGRVWDVGREGPFSGEETLKGKYAESLELQETLVCCICGEVPLDRVYGRHIGPIVTHMGVVPLVRRT